MSKDSAKTANDGLDTAQEAQRVERRGAVLTFFCGYFVGCETKADAIPACEFYTTAAASALVFALSRGKTLFKLQADEKDNSILHVVYRASSDDADRGDVGKDAVIEAGVQLAADLGVKNIARRSVVQVTRVVATTSQTFRVVPHSSEEYVGLENWPEEKELWLVRPTEGALVPVPIMLFLRDLFEEAGIRTYSLLNRAHYAELCSMRGARHGAKIPDQLPNGLVLLMREPPRAPTWMRFCEREEPEPMPELASFSCSDDELKAHVKRFAGRFSGYRPFSVCDPEWSSHDHFNYQSDSLSSQFVSWAAGRHSLRQSLSSAGAAEGGLTLPSCVGTTLLGSFGLINDWRNDVRGSHSYGGRSNVAFWAMVAFREALTAYRIQTRSNSEKSTFWKPDVAGVSIKAFAENMFDRPGTSCRVYTFYEDAELEAFMKVHGQHRLLPYSITENNIASTPNLANLANLAAIHRHISQSIDAKRYLRKARPDGLRFDSGEDHFCFVASDKGLDELARRIEAFVRQTESGALKQECVERLKHWSSTHKFHDRYTFDRWTESLAPLKLSESERKDYADSGHAVLLSTVADKVPNGTTPPAYFLAASQLYSSVLSASNVAPSALAAKQLLQSILARRRMSPANTGVVDPSKDESKDESKDVAAGFAHRGRALKRSSTSSDTGRRKRRKTADTSDAAHDDESNAKGETAGTDGGDERIPVVAAVLSTANSIPAWVRRELMAQQILPIEGGVFNTEHAKLVSDWIQPSKPAESSSASSSLSSPSPSSKKA